MSIKPSVSSLVISEMRDLGRSTTDRGVLEVDVSSGKILWANDFFLDKTGYSQDQVEHMTLFDIVPRQFHEELTDRLTTKKYRNSICPIRSADMKVVWWYTSQLKVEYPLDWTQGEYVQTTDETGVAFSFMRMTMETVNNVGLMQKRQEDMDKWVKGEVERLDASDENLRQDVRRIELKVYHAISSSKTAAQNSLNASESVEDLRGDFKTFSKTMEDNQDKATAEILRLIGSDGAQDKRIEAFEKHVKKTTELAIQSITMQAEKAGKGLSKKVTWPVSLIAAIATVVQAVIQHWTEISRFLSGHG
jgi:hypothetical protein